MVFFAEFGGWHPDESSKTDGDFSLKLQLTLRQRLGFSSIILGFVQKFSQSNKQTNKNIMLMII